MVARERRSDRSHFLWVRGLGTTILLRNRSRSVDRQRQSQRDHRAAAEPTQPRGRRRRGEYVPDASRRDGDAGEVHRRQRSVGRPQKQHSRGGVGAGAREPREEREEEQRDFRVERVDEDAAAEAPRRRRGRSVSPRGTVFARRSELVVPDRPHAEEDEIGRAGILDDPVRGGGRAEERGEAERRRRGVEEDAGRDSEGRPDAGVAALNSPCEDVHRVRAGREDERDGGRAEGEVGGEARNERCEVGGDGGNGPGDEADGLGSDGSGSGGSGNDGGYREFGHERHERSIAGVAEKAFTRAVA